MQFNISRNQLLSNLTIASKMIPTGRAAIPVLNNFFCEITDNEKLKVTASDSESSLTFVCDIIGFLGEKEVFLLPSRLIIEVLSSIPEQLILISIFRSRVFLDYSEGCSEILIGDSYEFPIIKANKLQPIDIAKETFFVGIETVIPFVHNDTRRSQLCCVYIERKKGKLAFVTTNATTLALYEEDSCGDDFMLLITSKIARIILTILKNGSYFKLFVSKNNVVMDSGSFYLITKMVDGRFPKFRAAIPTSSPYRITCSKEALKSALSRVSPYVNKAMRLVWLLFEKSNIRIIAEDSRYSLFAEENVPIEREVEQCLVIAFKLETILNVLSNMNAELLHIELTDEKHVVMIKPADDRTVVYLVMPLVTDEWDCVV